MIESVIAILEVVFLFTKLLWPIWLYMFLYVFYFYVKYKRSNYRFESGISFFKFCFNTGYFGEGLTFMEIEKLPFYGKIMTNLYIPTENGTTEIDLVYISGDGVYVIESKNYSGWIFGSENNKYWTAVLYHARNKFFNPIWQNKKHIKYLSEYVDVPIYSVIVFSDRCTLKRINLFDDQLTLLKRRHLKSYLKSNLSSNNYISNEKIDEMYERLIQFKLCSDEIKSKHIEIINNSIKE